jgi:hypothetical protein
MASAAMMIGGVLSTGGLAAVLVKMVGKKNHMKKSLRNESSKEKPWAK